MTLFARLRLSLLHEFVAHEIKHLNRNGGLFEQTSAIRPFSTHPPEARRLIDLCPQSHPLTHRETPFHRVCIVNHHPGRQPSSYAPGDGGFCGTARSSHFVPSSITAVMK